MNRVPRGCVSFVAVVGLLAWSQPVASDEPPNPIDQLTTRADVGVTVSPDRVRLSIAVDSENGGIPVRA